MAGEFEPEKQKLPSNTEAKTPRETKTGPPKIPTRGPIEKNRKLIFLAEAAGHSSGGAATIEPPSLPSLEEVRVGDAFCLINISRN
jgi:hypothetical protein